MLILSMLVLSIASAAGIATLDISVPRYEPYPAQPGEYADVWVKIENVGGEDATNVKITADPKFPFSLDSGEIALKELGTIRAGQYELVQYKLVVDEKAIQGDNEFDVKYSFSGFTDVTQRLNITVQTHDAILSVENISTEPQNFVPGKNTKVMVTVKNMDDAFLRDINIKLGVDNASLPFAPADSTSEKRIYQISAGDTQTLEFNILTKPDAEGGLYKVPITIEYTDSAGTGYTKSDIVAFTVGDVPKLSIILDESTIKTSGSNGKVSIMLVNSGLVNLKFLNLKLLESNDYTILSAKEEYIGNLDSDDTDNVDFDIYAKSGIKSLNLSFEVSYLDINNNEYNETFKMPVPLYSASQLSMFGFQTGMSPVFIVIILAVIGAAGFFVYKKFFAKKK
ncbi:MAG: COG1361 S-layer family protein [Candidatus Nanoarchaeia archaeon]|nr:COG1361 S-layer family protein [Candidatus Nanoarchaeia archaeon]MDD5239852.1 COG1361 S-layer family protein [Candidatus Nanoarchaeia archaeon]